MSREPKSESSVKPSPIALVVCDSIYQEPGGKTALVGLFNCIHTSAVPAKHPRMAIFASVTGVRQGSSAKLEIVHAENDSNVVTANGRFPENINNPTMVIDMNFVFSNLVFPEEGKYYIRFWCNDHLLLQRPFDVKLSKPKEQLHDKNP